MAHQEVGLFAKHVGQSSVASAGAEEMFDERAIAGLDKARDEFEVYAHRKG